MFAIDMIRAIRPTPGDFDRYFAYYYGPLLEQNDLQHVAGTKWMKIINDQVLFSVCFVPYRSMFYLYYSCQPLFYPVQFPKKQEDYNDRPMVFFDANAEYVRATGFRGVVDASPLFEKTRETTARYWQAVLEQTVLPKMEAISDVESCHRVYMERQKEWPIHGFDGRRLVENVFLHDDEDCAWLRDNQLVPILKQCGPNYCISLAYEGLQKKAENGTVGIPVEALIDTISGDRKLLWDWISKTEAKSRKTVKKLWTKAD